MNSLSAIVDKNQHRRVKSADFLFMTAPSMEDKNELYGIGMGNQMKELKELFSKKSDIDIYKIFKEYIGTKNMDMKVLKEPNHHWVHVDKAYTEENNLIGIFCVENKYPNMDMYYSSNIKLLKEDLEKFLEGNKES